MVGGIKLVSPTMKLKRRMYVANQERIDHNNSVDKDLREKNDQRWIAAQEKRTLNPENDMQCLPSAEGDATDATRAMHNERGERQRAEVHGEHPLKTTGNALWATHLKEEIARMKVESGVRFDKLEEWVGASASDTKDALADLVSRIVKMEGEVTRIYGKLGGQDFESLRSQTEARFKKVEGCITLEGTRIGGAWARIEALDKLVEGYCSQAFARIIRIRKLEQTTEKNRDAININSEEITGLDKRVEHRVLWDQNTTTILSGHERRADKLEARLNIQAAKIMASAGAIAKPDEPEKPTHIACPLCDGSTQDISFPREMLCRLCGPDGKIPLAVYDKLSRAFTTELDKGEHRD